MRISWSSTICCTISKLPPAQNASPAPVRITAATLSSYEMTCQSRSISGCMNASMVDPEIIKNPSHSYKMLRENYPCYWKERWRGWALPRYEDVYGALHSPKMLADRITPFFKTRLNDEERERFALTYQVLHSF